MESDIRQILSDMAIKEMLAEIDADTIRRYERGHRCVPGPNGPEWVYYVDDNGQHVDEKGNPIGDR